ncbi:anti-sigma factor [Neolewinella lacunae]|uniref:Regulator of SigK n=1 Tax=Neolewinella lacunae TaxID=1517758 RepID=A0A923PS73_9BACT|nr:anti-sigma factor [Neolewinella lacunae]MBC6996529.1 anti-sigma factor [Neolewinella lacunae]MDN3634906.1 anti-sigma factor [Neolewinella lacunae]
MDITKYIASGVLELYVLDRLEPAERREVERYASEHPEIRAEIASIESSLEALAEADARMPDPSVLTRVLASLGDAAPPAPPTASTLPPAAPPPPANPLNWLPWTVALLMAAAALVLFFGRQSDRSAYDDLRGQFDSLQSDYERQQALCDTTELSLRAAELRLQTVTNPATTGILLAGTPNAPNSSAIVFYNPVLNETFFRATNLPPPPAGKQYQLWAIDASGPKDLGVLAFNLSNSNLLSVPHLSDVAAFAITLEDVGGKPTPDLSQLQVIGNVS